MSTSTEIYNLFFFGSGFKCVIKGCYAQYDLVGPTDDLTKSGTTWSVKLILISIMFAYFA